MIERRMLTGHTPELLRRKCEDFLARLAKRFGDMKGKIEISMRPEVSFADIGDLAHAKQEIAGLVCALQSPDLHKKWGAQPPNGVLLYGPPGTGKTLLAMALAREAEAVFFHVRVTNVVAKGRGRGRARPGDHRGHAAGDRELSQDQGDHREDSLRAVLVTARGQRPEIRGRRSD